VKPEQCPECKTPRPPIIYDRPDKESSWEYWLGCADCHATSLAPPQPTTDLAIRVWNEWAVSIERMPLVKANAKLTSLPGAAPRVDGHSARFDLRRT